VEEVMENSDFWFFFLVFVVTMVVDAWVIRRK
jgi:hypothetical protein